MVAVGASAFHDLALSARAALLQVRAGDWSAWDTVAAQAVTTLDQAEIGALVRSRAEGLSAQERIDLVRRTPEVGRLRADDPTALTAYVHVRITMGFVPLVPEVLVSWRPPGSCGYRDIGAPTDLADLLGRIAVLERTLWRLAGHREVADADLRRLYAFWESGLLWTTRELAHGVEPRA